MKNILLIPIVLLLFGCQNLSPKVVEISPENVSGCTYISNIDALLETYVIHKPNVNYSGNIGYQALTLGGSLQEQRDFVALQTKLSQQGAAINNAVKAIIILSNKSCTPQSISKGWEALNNIVDTVGTVYSPVLLEKAKQGIVENIVEYENKEHKEIKAPKTSVLNMRNAGRMFDLYEKRMDFNHEKDMMPEEEHLE